MSDLRNQRNERRGLTLTELLVVVSIVVLLAGILVPLVQPVLRGQKVREASRQVNVMFAAAQARAVETGRPAGIWIERAGHPADPDHGEPGDPPQTWYTAYKVFSAEQPDPYVGDLFESRVVIRQASPGLYAALFQEPTAPATANSCCVSVFPLLNSGRPIVEPGDTIRFEGLERDFIIHSVDAQKFTFKVPLKRLTNGTPVSDPTVQKLIRLPTPGDQAKLVGYQPGVRFSVTRRPVKTTSPPLELPRNTGIDLSVSGYDSPMRQTPYVGNIPNHIAGYPTRFREVSPEYDIVIMFSPDGGIDRVHYIAHREDGEVPAFSLDTVSEHPYFWEQPQGPISLMIARDSEIARDLDGNVNISATRADQYSQLVTSPLGLGTLSSTDNIWITLNGTRVSSAPNANAYENRLTNTQLQSFTGDARGVAGIQSYVWQAQRFARSPRSMGGR